MEKNNKGMVIVKKNGITFKISRNHYDMIRLIVFEGESPLCKNCKHVLNCPRKIGDDYIIDGVTLVRKDIVEDERLGISSTDVRTENYILKCDNYEETPKEVYLYGYHGDFPDESSSSTINPIKKYGDAYRASVINPRVKKSINHL